MKALTRPTGIKGKQYTVEETSKLLGVHVVTVYKWIGSGQIPEDMITRRKHSSLRIKLDKLMDLWDIE